MSQVVEPFQYPAKIAGCACAICTRWGRDKDVPSKQATAAKPVPVFQRYKLVKVDYWGQPVDLTEDEVKALEFSQPKVAEEWSGNVQTTSWWKLCMKILRSLLKQKNANAFKAPVDPVALNIPDYFNFIKHPMDFGTIEARLNAQPCHYAHPDEFVSDVRLVFRNCYIYNAEGTAVWVWAMELSKLFESQILANQLVPVVML